MEEWEMQEARYKQKEKRRKEMKRVPNITHRSTFLLHRSVVLQIYYYYSYSPCSGLLNV
jgi:hypothetical protein